MFLLDLVVTHWREGLEVGAALFVCYVVGFAVYNRCFHPYRHFPGPFWASITGYWYFNSVRHGLGDNTQWQLHRKYGPMVRVAPGMVAIADPAAIDTIYGMKNTFRKSGFYDGFHPNISKRRDAFCDRDDRHHATRKRITGPLYTQGNVLRREPQFDRVISLFYQQMERFVDREETFDVSIWLRKYTFDIIGELFYGREGGFGFIADNIDYQNWCKILEVMPAPVSALTYVPYGFRGLYMASQMLNKDSRIGMKGFYTVIEQAHAATRERLEEMKAPDYKRKDDLLNQMIEDVEKRGDNINWHMIDVTTELWATIWQASDTTAIALTSIFYHLHKSPRTLTRLLEEIDGAFEKGLLSYPVRFNDAIKLPYLHAVVMESMRIHSSLGTGLPRLVPSEGAEICGRHFAGGYEVVMNAMAVQFDHGVFGWDAETFVPERWLRPENDPVRMEKSMLQFGYGPRMCAGRHVSVYSCSRCLLMTNDIANQVTNTEMYKLLPTILRDFRFELLVDEWTVFRGWFQSQKNVMVKVSRRKPKREGVENLGF